MAASAARAASGGNSGGGGLASLVTNLANKPEAQAAMGNEVPGQGGLIGSGTAAVGAAAPAAAGASDPFSGQKFELTPVKMKGRFSEKSKATAEGVYGSEEERNNFKR